jgi:hypothetical protein
MMPFSQSETVGCETPSLDASCACVSPCSAMYSRSRSI